jgi:Spy/CpxP family protein refolding chaperone
MFGIVVGAGLVVVGAAMLACHRRSVHRGLLRCALHRLKTTDEQQQRLQALAEETHVKVDTAKERARKLRVDLVGLWEAPQMDPQRLEALESQLFEAVGEATQALREGMLRAHEILEPEQRERVATWLRRAHRHHCCGHSTACCH